MGDDVLASEFAFEDAVAIAVAALGVCEHSFASIGHIQRTYLGDDILGFHAVRTDILHSRRADLARDITQILHAGEPHVAKLGDKIIKHKSVLGFYPHVLGVLFCGTRTAHRRVQDHAVEVAGEEQVAARTDVQDPLAFVLLKQGTEFVEAMVLGEDLGFDIQAESIRDIGHL